ncbi:MAG: hydantoinase/oxoprolinase family protein, partial [Anaerolineae bacterium]|nr:hydantoinase/oxoprolinase family protein [Anaerolineae bacterium]
MNQPFLLAVDIGGTFTDIVLLNQNSNALMVGKVLTTYPDPSQGVLGGVKSLLAAEAVPTHQVQRVIHGTTLVTNTLIERSGARTALLTTEGFRDALEIGNEGRYDIYDLGLIKPTPLVERRLRLELPERMDAQGRVVTPLDEAALRQVCDHLRAEGIEAVAVCYLHAYANPRHELTTADLLSRHLPAVPVTLSHQVAPAMREYQRTSTAVANAYVQPLAERYMGRLEAGLHAAGVEAPLNIMLSNGGTCTVETATAFPIRLTESGPSGGALAGAYWGQRAGYDEILAFDMGGTTAKAVLTEKGEFAVVTESEVAHVHRFKRGSGLPLLVPMLHMIEIGAGGGSIAHLGPLGLPTVGPESASSTPGPVCYGRGGTNPTVTDADLVLGYLNPAEFAQGTMTLDVEAARSAFEPLAAKLDLSRERVAWGVHQLVNENMAAAARVHAAERGLDMRRYAMVATGGAGPVHACGVAHRLGLDTVVIPPLAGVGSAFGFLLAPTAFDFTRSYLVNLDAIDLADINTILTDLETEGRAIVGAAGVAAEDITVSRTVDMRYRGQGYEVRVPFGNGPVDAAQLDAIRHNFEQEYTRFYGRLTDGVPLQAVNWRVVIAGPSLDLSTLQAPMPPEG